MATKRPPYGGIVKISPSSGYMTMTFTVTIINWKGEKPIYYRIWATEEVAKDEYEPSELIVEEWISSVDDASIKLVNQNPLLVEVTDESGEFAMKQAKVKIIDDLRFLASDVNKLDKEELDLQTRFSELQDWCGCVEDLSQNFEVNQAEVLDVRGAIVDQIKNAVQDLSYESKSTADKLIMEQSVGLLPSLVEKPNFLNRQIFNDVVEILEQITVPEAVFTQLVSIDEFR